jgi:hypothetical protein
MALPASKIRPKQAKQSNPNLQADEEKSEQRPK